MFASLILKHSDVSAVVRHRKCSKSQPLDVLQLTGSRTESHVSALICYPQVCTSHTAALCPNTYLLICLLIYSLFNHAPRTSDTSAYNADYRKPSYNADLCNSDLIISEKINVKNYLPNVVIHGLLNIRQQHTRHICTWSAKHKTAAHKTHLYMVC